MKVKELRELGKNELQQKLKEANKELLSLRIQQVNQQLKDPLKLRVGRRTIARILTIIREKGEK